MQKALILGAGGLGREVLTYALASGCWQIEGFLDADSRALDGSECGYPIVGDPLQVIIPDDVQVLCAIGDPGTKLAVCEQLKRQGVRFGTVVHPTAVIGRHCKLGVGCVVGPYACLTSDVTLGDFVTVNVSVVVGHDAVIGDGCTLNPHAAVSGRVTLGRGVLLGAHAAVLQGLSVGDYAIVGAGSVAVRRVAGHSTLFGVPAMRLVVNNDRVGEGCEQGGDLWD